MIKSLTLENFGRFHNKKFDFAPITFFSGNNETGKTTIFDAISVVISSPNKNSFIGKIINKRYGEGKIGKPDIEGDPVSITDKDFLNLFAVRSGTISLDIEDNLQWMNQVKASLFSGGIDPKSIAKELENELGTKKAGSLLREEKDYKAELERRKNEKKNFESIRQECFKEEKKIAQAENRLKQITEEISMLTKLEEELEKSLYQQNLYQQAKVLKDICDDAVDWQSNKDEQEKNARFTNEKYKEIEGQEAEASRIRKEADKAAILEQETKSQLVECTGEKARYEAEKSRWDSAGNLAGLLKDSLVPREKLIQQKTSRIWKKPLLIIAGFSIVAGCLAFFLTSFGWGVLAAALGIAGICVVMSTKKQPYDDTSALDKAISSAQNRWKKETGEDIGLHYDDIIDAFTSAIEKSRAAKAAYDVAAGRLSALDKEARARDIDKTRLNDEANAAQRRLRELLDEAGVANVPEYAKKLGENQRIVKDGEEIYRKLKDALVEYNASSPVELERIIRFKLEEITGSITTEKELSPPELRAKKEKLEDTKRKLEILDREESECNGSLNWDQGTIQQRLKDLPEKIAACEKGIEEINKKLEEIKREFRAKKIAKELFDVVAEDSSLMFDELSREIGESFSAITEAGRKVTMENFSMDDICVTDAQGSDLKKDRLSAGTRDAFLLAARLVLARKSLDSGSRAIIVLDDPFLTLDRPRTGRALLLLKEFHIATQWQLVFFTKDEETVKQARTVFGSDLCVHELT